MVPSPRRPHSIVLLAVPVVALVLALSACGAEPAAVVDGESVSDQELERDQAYFTLLAALNQQKCGQKLSGETQSSACARYTLSSIIQEVLVKHFAEENGISVPESEVTATVEQLESGLGTEKLEEQLEAVGMTRTELASFAGRLLLFTQVRNAFGEKDVTQPELHELYRQEKLRFTQIHAKHILVKTRAEADRIESLVTAENFGDLAMEYSTDPGSAENDGDLGTYAASALDSTFVEAALALQPGEISAPVHTQFGWHIIQLVSVEVTPFSQVESQLKDTLAAQAFSDWLGDRLANADITVNPKYGRLNRKTGEVVPVESSPSTSTTPSSSNTASASPTP
ncbi:MAG: peptidylprolyl isomerase [Actinomycetota bacterium]